MAAAAAAGLKRPTKKEAVADGGGLRSVVDSIAARYTDAAKRVSTLYARATPYITWTSDTAWAVGSTAVLLALPVLLEIQRETTVLVMQKQREREMQEMQDQARMANGAGIVDTVSAVGRMLTGSTPAGAA